MRITSYTELPTYEISGNALNIYFDPHTHEPKEDETEPYWTYELCRAQTTDGYDALVVKLLRTRYSLDDELAAINDGGERHADFLQFRAQIKLLAKARFDD